MRSKRWERWLRLAVALAAAATLAACGGAGSSGSASEDTVRYVGVREQGLAAVAAAETQGIFGDHGLTFEPTWTDSGATILQGVVSGDFDIGRIGASQLYAAIENDTCLKMLRPTQGASYDIIARRDAGLEAGLPLDEALAQLKGKTIGVAALGAAQDLVMRKLLADAGLNPDSDVTFVAIGAGPSALTAIDSGQVDAALGYSQLEVNLDNNGTEYNVVASMTGGGADGPLGAFWQSVEVANCDFVEEHPETVEKFCESLDAGLTALAEDPAVGPASFVYAQLGADTQEAKALWERFGQANVDIPPVDEATWAHQSDFVATGFTPDMNEYLVPECQ